jgi:hypothetical protein
MTQQTKKRLEGRYGLEGGRLYQRIGECSFMLEEAMDRLSNNEVDLPTLQNAIADCHEVEDMLHDAIQAARSRLGGFDLLRSYPQNRPEVE